MNMGLGLYFCRKVVEAHEGSIRLEGDENDNKFIVELPILKENAVYIKEIVSIQSPLVWLFEMFQNWNMLWEIDEIIRDNCSTQYPRLNSYKKSITPTP